MINLRTPWNSAMGTACLFYVLTLLPAAHASSIISTFSVVNTNADGSVIIPSSLYPGDPTSFDLIGGNNGSGESGETDFIGTAATTGTVQFVWSYTSCYPPNSGSTACDDPTYDWTGFVVNQVENPAYRHRYRRRNRFSKFQGKRRPGIWMVRRHL